MIRFAILVVFLMAAQLSAVFLAEHQRWIESSPTFTVEIILFLGLSTLIICYFLVQHVPSASFTQAFLISMVLKMLAYATFILVILFSDRAAGTANALLFLLSYALFTAFEVAFLFRRINSRS